MAGGGGFEQGELARAAATAGAVEPCGSLRTWRGCPSESAPTSSATSRRRIAGRPNVLGNLGLAHAVLGELRRAIDFYEQQLVIVRGTGDRRAIKFLTKALNIFVTIESPNAGKARATIARLEKKGGV
jgi:hypothetical protein